MSIVAYRGSVSQLEEQMFQDLAELHEAENRLTDLLLGLEQGSPREIEILRGHVDNLRAAIEAKQAKLAAALGWAE